MLRRFTTCAEVFILSMLFIFIGATGATRAQEKPSLSGRYFLVVWSYQGPDDDVVHAHTFVSFYDGNDLAKGVVRPATISWLPASGTVHLFGAEKGHNF